MKFTKIGIAGTLALIFMWGVMAKQMSPLTMASPLEALETAAHMLTNRQFLMDHILVTLYRVLLALVVGSTTGFFLGLTAGNFPVLMEFLEPFRRVSTGIPGVVVAVLAMLWFGLGSTMAIFLGSVFIAPVVYINVAENIRQCDRVYMEMARIYRLSMSLRLRFIYIPMVAAALASSLVIVTGNSMRLVILAEVLGTGNGLGYILGLSRARLDMPTLYGCVLLCLIFVWGTEVVIKKLMSRWLHV